MTLKKSIFPCFILAAIIALAAALRFHDLTKVGLWPDEFWSSVHLATGRGTEIFDLPRGVLLDPPPETLLQDAPPWWHIWTGLHGIIHPPLYLILLRWWMDIFGPGDFSTRTFSVIASLAGIAVLYAIVRQTVSAQAGLIAAAIMTLSPMQINLAQESRPYPLLTFFALLAAHAILRIERQGISPARLIQLALALVATALTHYFSLGALVAIFVYTLIRLDGKSRRRVLAVFAAAALFVLIIWGPFLWQQHREFFRQQDWSLEPYATRSMPFVRAAALPAAYFFGRPGSELTWLAPCIIAYLFPLILLRRSKSLLFWWLWISAVIAQILAYDLINHSRLLATLKYTSLAAVAVYAIGATPLPIAKWPRWAIAYLLLIAVAIATAQRIQEGPPEDNGDWRGMAQTLNHLAGPRDPLVFYPSPFWGPSAMYYLAVAHYAPNADRPVMFLDDPATPNAQRQLAKFSRIWLIGPNVVQDTSKYLPGWNSVFSRGFPNSGSIAELEKPQAP
jgi:uncharacterized membrane protein